MQGIGGKRGKCTVSLEETSRWRHSGEGLMAFVSSSVFEGMVIGSAGA